MIHCDFHMHSCFSSDSETPMELMIEQAIRQGLTQICFTDHMDYNFPVMDPEHPLDFQFDPEEYVNTIRALKDRYHSEIDVLTGIELGLKPGIEEKVRTLLNQYDFDFIIGSSHLLYNKDPYFDCFWDELRKESGLDSSLSASAELDHKIVKKAIRDYFEEILKNVDLFSGFQVYGHLDYIVRYAPGNGAYYQVQDYLDVLEEILKRLLASGRGIEINTSALKKGFSFANPHPDILKLYHDLGGEIITVGADAHVPEHIGYRFDLAREFLMNAGFRYYTTFKGKKAEFHQL